MAAAACPAERCLFHVKHCTCGRPPGVASIREPTLEGSLPAGRLPLCELSADLAQEFGLDVWLDMVVQLSISDGILDCSRSWSAGRAAVSRET